MIDLNQVSLALRNSTPRSLILLDEFGKGTISSGNLEPHFPLLLGVLPLSIWLLFNTEHDFQMDQGFSVAFSALFLLAALLVPKLLLLLTFTTCSNLIY